MRERGEDMPVQERLENHDTMISNLNGRVTTLEKKDREKERRIENVERNYTQLNERVEDLKTTIVNENKETRQFFQSNMDKQWDLIKSRDEQHHDTKKMNHELSKTKAERYSDIALKLLGAGGIVYIIVQNLLN